MHKLLIAALLAVFSTSAMAEWTYLTSSNNYGTYDHYIDKTTIRKQGNIVKIWAMTDFKSPQKSGDETYSSMRSLQEYDCAGVRSRYLTKAAFSGNMLEGDNILELKGHDDWEDIAPNTVGIATWKAACKK